MKVLLTGSCGFLGSNFIIYALQNTKWDLVSIDKLTSGSLMNVPQVKRHKLYIGDVCDYHFTNKIFEIEQPDTVIHAACEDGNSAGNFVSTNIIGTHSLLEAARHAHTPEKFINISSCSVYGNLNEGLFTEECALHPSDTHATTKASADLLGQSYVSSCGLPVITARVCDVYGPRQPANKLIPSAFLSALEKNKFVLTGGENSRERVYIKDVFLALKFLIEQGVPGQIYNIGSGCVKTNAEVVSKMFELLEQPTNNMVQNTGSSHDLSRALSSEKINILGWKAQYNFDEALLHTIFWYKANGGWFFKKQ